jgi:hypothetical protein
MGRSAHASDEQNRADKAAGSAVPPEWFGRLGDKEPDGTPVCPNYDETRMRKGKYPTKFKGNGKGKQA